MKSKTEKMAHILIEMIDKRGSRRSFAEEIGMPPTTLQSMLTKDLGRASINNVIEVCRGLGITVDQLEQMAINDANNIETIAAHHVGDEWSEEERRDIEEFKKFVRMRREHRKDEDHLR